jgi:starch synthase
MASPFVGYREMASEDISLKVLHVATEMAPLVKVGGLGDVVGSLPKALKKLGADVRLLLPAYPNLLEELQSRQSAKPIGKLYIALNWRVYEASVYEFDFNGIPVYLLDQPELYSDSVYPQRLDCASVLPFALLSMASLELPNLIDWTPQLIHAHDWPTALIPILLRWHRHYSKLSHSHKAILTIHNLAHQGILPKEILPSIGLADEAFSIDGVEFYGSVNLLKGGIIAADAVTTVSPRYSWEIQTPSFGMGLDGVIESQKHKLHGILNGLDYEYWNPATDQFLPAIYSKDDLSGKEKCSRALSERCGFDDGRPIAAFVGRLVEQKGIDILLAALNELVKMGFSLVVLGSGHENFEMALEGVAAKLKKRLSVHIGYFEELAHLIYAGSDMLLMPSLFEPCGLSQLIAMRYGTVPVARAVGGLADTIIDADGNPEGYGFLFSNPSPDELLKCAERAIAAWSEEERWRKIILRGMSADFSWDRSAKAYAELYHQLLSSQ